jgi:hypothetical protein
MEKNGDFLLEKGFSFFLVYILISNNYNVIRGFLI